MPRILTLCALLATSTVTLSAQASNRVPVIPAGQSASATLTPGIRVGDIVYASGQLGTSRDNPNATIQEQTTRALENTAKVFEAAGTSMANAVKCTVFLIEVADFQGMNQAYRAFFPDSPPARSTVVVKALVVPNATVEIECMAVIPKS